MVFSYGWSCQLHWQQPLHAIDDYVDYQFDDTNKALFISTRSGHGAFSINHQRHNHVVIG